MLNYIWLAFLLVAVLVGGFTGRLPQMTTGAFDMAKVAVMNIALPLIGLYNRPITPRPSNTNHEERGNHGPTDTMTASSAQIENPQGLIDPEDCTRNSSSPIPQPTRERRSTLLAGLLAHGSPYSPRLPIHRGGQWHSRVSSPFTAAGPRGTCTLFPYPGVTMWRAL